MDYFFLKRQNIKRQMAFVRWEILSEISSTWTRRVGISRASASPSFFSLDWSNFLYGEVTANCSAQEKSESSLLWDWKVCSLKMISYWFFFQHHLERVLNVSSGLLLVRILRRTQFGLMMQHGYDSEGILWKKKFSTYCEWRKPPTEICGKSRHRR